MADPEHEPADHHAPEAHLEPETWHESIEPGILYVGTPVVLHSTENPDGTANLAPMSSLWFLGWRAMVGMSTASQTARNLQRTGEIVLNLPTAEQATAVDRLALTTGRTPVPEYKVERGYRHVADKFAAAGLTAVPSQTVRPPRAAECPIAIEAVLESVHRVAEDDEQQRGGMIAAELRVQRVQCHPWLRVPGHPRRIDPDRWRPLIMSFQHFYGLGDRVHPSRLASISEDFYRGPDIDRAHQARTRG